MGKSGKLLKNLVAGVRSFKSPSKERPPKDDKECPRKKSMDKCFGSLGKSSSRNREGVTAISPALEAIDIKCVNVDSEKLNSSQPMLSGDSFVSETYAETKVHAKSQEEATDVSGAGMEVLQIGTKETAVKCEEVAASKIQSAFRGYLARRAFQTLKAIIHLQAAARGWMVRKQASSSLKCFNSLVRVQALARGHRVRNSELGQLVQKHIQQARQPKRKTADGWVSSTSTAQQLHAKAQVKQDAVTKRQRALVYAFSEQLNRRTQKQSSSSGLESLVDKSHWIWPWLERWAASALKGSPSSIHSEDCSPVKRNTEKTKGKGKGPRPSDISRRERRKSNEHTDSISSLSQRYHEPDEHEESITIVKMDKEMKILPETEKLEAPKSSMSVIESAMTAESQMHVPSPQATSTAPRTSLREENTSQTRESRLYEDQPTNNPVREVDGCISVGHQAEMRTAAEPNAYESNNTVSDASDGNHVSGIEINSQSACPAVNAAVNAYPLSSNGQSEELKSNYSSVFSFSPSHEVCSPSGSCSSAYAPKDLHASSSMTNTLSHEPGPGHSVSNGTCKAEINHATEIDDVCATENTVGSSNGQKDGGQHSCDDHTNGDGTWKLIEPQATAAESAEFKDVEPIEIDYSSEPNGGCNISTASACTRAANDIPTKNISSVGSKNAQSENQSPGVPSYMATTMSSKAKLRTVTSPKQKSDSPKQRTDFSKSKLESPKTKADSPSTSASTTTTATAQRSDSTSKRRHSLSVLDGKITSSVIATTQKPTFHVRVGSKGTFSSMRDLSTDNFSLSNGDSRRHGK
ncbi:hypothetical protein KP509_14G076300 [Ceratopteris richardii]|uniref:DUF4005 domain-containing protein n=1 Tax=Ceratopteris richardii TaxID=49495 RepID=A0A8T2TAZ8_CERRI|nr:hypothetical protein KP509_14G076300 [Ceratopteris richardii]KAH7416117.1 hypothetical protein KP509_14G076300 [Ceratopteris richardii]KAH7416118.1 hypothetical protein KP509_14G076300 [Ceratopteris richardii]KAH7416119.1 hypothetical protein KP509_14G076300 [Ceratopteris richardii]